MIFGLEPASGGEIRLNGEPVSPASPEQAIALGIAYLPEDRRRHGVILDLPVDDNLTLAALGDVSRTGCSIARGRRDRRRPGEGARREDAGRLPRRCGISPAATSRRSRSAAGSCARRAAHPRRADAGRGRRREGGNPPAHWRARRARHRRPDDFVRAARGARHERPHRRDAPGGRLAATFTRDAATAERVMAAAFGTALRPRDAAPRRGARAAGRAALVALLALLALLRTWFFSPANLRDVVMQQRRSPGHRHRHAAGRAHGPGRRVGRRHVRRLRRRRRRRWRATACRCRWQRSLAVLPARHRSGNGVLVGGLGLPSIVVSLAMLVVLRDGLRWATEGAWVRDLPAAFQWFGLGQSAGRGRDHRRHALVIALAGVGLRHLAAGRALYAHRQRPGVRASGRPVPIALSMGAFVVCGGLTGLAAVLNAVRFGEVPGASAQASS